METDVEFPVGGSTFEEVSELISQNGIKLEPLVRIRTEKYPGTSNVLPEGLIAKDSVDVNGVLWFKDKSFTFSFCIVENKSKFLRVDVGDQNLITANQLVEALNTIFPTHRPFPSRILSTSTNAVGDQLGCLGIILIIVACLFFFGYGVYRFFVP